MLSALETSQVREQKLRQKRGELPFWMRELRNSSTDFDFTHKGRLLLETQRSEAAAGKNRDIFSTEVQYFKDLREPQRRVLVADSERLYFFTPNSHKLIVSLRIREIENVFAFTRSGELILLLMERTHPYLLHTVHRLELAYYLLSLLNKTLHVERGLCLTERVVFSQGGENVHQFPPSED